MLKRQSRRSTKNKTKTKTNKLEIKKELEVWIINGKRNENTDM